MEQHRFTSGKSPHKSASPTVQDIDANVSVLANKPKPATPFMYSSGEILGERGLAFLPAPLTNKASPIQQLLESEILASNS